MVIEDFGLIEFDLVWKECVECGYMFCVFLLFDFDL